MDKVKLQELVGSGLTTYQIANSLGKSQTTICYWLKKYEIPIERKFSRGRKRAELTNQCLNCNGSVTKISKYCNHFCQQEHRFKVYINQWKTGGHNGVVGGLKTSNHIRRYLFEKYNNQCALCGWHKINPYTNKIPLEIEHIDGNHENNKEENLILVCPNCHSLTATFRALNKGNGREKRRKLLASVAQLE